MLEQLSQEQIDQIPVIRDKWIKIGLSTGKTDKKRVEEAIDLVYQCADLEPPSIKRWAKSPLEGAKIAAQFAADKDSSYEPTSAELREQLNKGGYGTHDASWLSFFDYFNKVCGIETPSLAGLKELGQCSGWWWPFENAVVLSELPTEIHLDDEHRLHNPEGQALSYPDGFGIMSWHGVRVPDDLILDPGSYTATRVVNEKNAEIRRCMIEHLGVAILEDAGSVISEDTQGVLLKVEMEEDEDMMLVKVLNSTPEKTGEKKIYFLRVPPDITTPTEGIAWTFEKNADQYNPVLQT
jgi:hypothetical protein